MTVGSAFLIKYCLLIYISLKKTGVIKKNKIFEKFILDKELVNLSLFNNCSDIHFSDTVSRTSKINFDIFKEFISSFKEISAVKDYDVFSWRI